MDEEETAIAVHLEWRQPSRRFASAVTRVTESRAAIFGTSETIMEIAQPLHATGEWLLARYNPRPSPSPGRAMLVAAATGSLLAGAAAAWIAARVSRPLSALALAADEVARGGAMPRLNSQGPTDFQRTAEAFNTMVERVTYTLTKQRKMLSAVGHDLRTPLAALRLSTEFVDDDLVRGRLLDDIDQLQRVTEQLLAEARAEQVKRVHQAA
jgi:signal transduction histidine kinase